jgi:hypothetical protein
LKTAERKTKVNIRKTVGPALFEWNLWDAKKFRDLKKMMVGKSREESLDLLDEWILKKRAWSLFL